MSTTENKLIIKVDRSASIARLVEFGNQQGFVTYDDILKILPEAEEDSNWLENAFAGLINAGIQYIENDQDREFDNPDIDQDDEFDDLVDVEFTRHEHMLSSTDADDMVGMYFNDAARHDLLTLEQEKEIARRIERGQLAREELSHSKTTLFRQRELKQQIDDGWIAMDQLFKSNSRLVISIAKKHVR